MKSSTFLRAALCALPWASAHADLASGLLAYYDFEQAGTTGLTNRVGGGATHNGRYANGVNLDVPPAFGGGAGFGGDAAFAGAEPGATTDRTSLLLGNALNVVKSDASSTAGSGWFTVPTLDAATLGTSFSVSAWFFLAPDADNTGGVADVLRDYVFEASTNFDVSFGTSDADGTSYVSWVGQAASVNTGSLNAGEWNHVVHVFRENGANIELVIYINGNPAGTVLTSPAANFDFTALNFGAARNGVRVFDGMLDEIAVWDRSLSANEVIEVNSRGKASLTLTADLAAAGKGFISVEANDRTMGTTFGTGLYDLNETVVIDALPAVGHVFGGWAAPYNNRPEFFDHVVTGSETFFATFARDLADDDGDGLSNYDEAVVHLTDPDSADTDGDGIDDGDEVNTTGTSPVVSQIDVVNYIVANLGGGVGPGDTVLTANGSGALTLKVTANASTDLAAWPPLTPGSSGVSASATGGALRIQVPATTDTKRFFRVSGE